MNIKNNLIHCAWRVMLALVFALSIVGIPSSHVSAGTTLTVNSTGDGVDVTHEDGVCETGTGNGVCTLRAAIEETNSLAGADTITFSVSGTITLGSNLPQISQDLVIDATYQDITIDGNDLSRPLQISTGTSVTLTHLNIINGLDGLAGGGIYSNGTLQVTDCTFSGNTSFLGGAIAGVAGTLTVTNSTFSSNVATGGGGAIYMENGTLTVTNSTVAGNSAYWGGGIGVYQANTFQASTVTVKNSTFSGNTAIESGGTGGAMHIPGGTLTVTNSTFSGNHAFDKGGGIYSELATVAVTNTTFSGNGATGMGGGIYIASGTFNLKNTILANSTSGGDCYNGGTLASNTRNLIENTSTCGTPYSSADPVLGALADNGGPTQTFALLTGSPAIDAGDDATCAAAAVNSYDQRGSWRFHDWDGDGVSHCDIGSYELLTSQTFVVSNTNDSGPGSLRQAVINSNTNIPQADTITFSVGGTIPLVTGFSAWDDLTIDGSGKDVIISGGNSTWVMNVPSGISVALNHLSIINGSASGSSGAGILNSGGTLTLTDCTLSGNEADSGGGIFTEGGTLNVTNSIFSSNSADYGGAIYSNKGTVTITNSTFSGNTGIGDGGAIYIMQYTNPSTLVLANNTFSGNSALNGGAIYNSAGSVTVTNSTFSGNLATTRGGGIYNTDSLTVTNSTLSGNSAGEYGGGIYNAGSSLNITNTIIANSGGGSDCWSEIIFPSAMNSIIENVVACGTPLTTADPKLGPLANNGGSTKTFALLTGSPAIDAGDDATCAAAPVSNLDQRGTIRPQGAHCDIGSVEARNLAGTLTLRSVGTQDGWILESTEASNVGGTLNTIATTFNLGDEAGDKQYRAVLSFNTASLPDTAIITKVTLKIKRPATGYLVGNNSPFAWGMGLKVDVCRNFFGTSAALQLGDFNFTNATNCRLLVGAFGGTPAASWYSANILSTAFTRINRIGTTQFRLRFAKDDNDDNAADYMKFYSGNFATATARPTLVIEYYIP